LESYLLLPGQFPALLFKNTCSKQLWQTWTQTSVFQIKLTPRRIPSPGHPVRAGLAQTRQLCYTRCE